MSPRPETTDLTILGNKNNCGDDYGMDILYDEHLGDTIITGNTGLSGNISTKRRDLVLSYLHIGLQISDKKQSI